MRGARLNPLSFGFLRALAGVDVVHCMSWNTLVTDFSILLARALGKRVFVTDMGGGASLTLVRWLPLARLVDRYLLIAEQGGAQFERFRSRWSILYAGIDVDRYRPEPGRQRRGVLYVGLMITREGPKLIEYNVRFGDPECQALMPRLKDDLLTLMVATCDGTLDQVSVRWIGSGLR